MTGALTLDGLSKRFGQTLALDDVNFGVAPGTLVGFLGPNGAGKTTTMRAIMGLVELDDGAIRFGGAPVDAATRRRFGYMPAERGLYPNMAVRDQVAYFGRLGGLDRVSAERATATWIERLGLTARARDQVQALSSGNQQRVQLAITLVHDPDLLILDEPFQGLDPLAVDELSAVLRETAAAGSTVLLSSHQLDLVASVCPEVVVIDHGAIVMAGEVERLREASPRRNVELRFASSTTWAPPYAAHVHLSDDRRTVRAVVDAATAADDLLRDAATHGTVLAVTYGPPDLSEVFRDAVGR